MEALEASVAETDEIVECRRMFGDPDYLLWVAAQDLDAYEDVYIAMSTRASPAWPEPSLSSR